VENGTDRVVQFSIMINGVFLGVHCDIGRSLFADDGALWKRGKNIYHIKGKVQEDVKEVER